MVESIAGEVSMFAKTDTEHNETKAQNRIGKAGRGELIEINSLPILVCGGTLDVQSFFAKWH